MNHTPSVNHNHHLEDAKLVEPEWRRVCGAERPQSQLEKDSTVLLPPKGM